MKTIAVDIDDTLAAFAPAVTEFSNQQWGMQLTPDDYSEDWSQMWRVDPVERDIRGNIVETSGIQATLKHDVYALDTLRYLKNDYRLIIISSRPANLQQVSIDWVNRHYPDIFDDIQFADMWNDRSQLHVAHLATKADICQKLEVDYLIDDQLKHCVAVADIGISAVLFGDYRWNKSEILPSKVVRAHNWNEVRSHFTKIGATA